MLEEHDLTNRVVNLLKSQPWASQRRIHVEYSCSGSSSSRYIHTEGGDETVTLRISDHEYGVQTFQILTSDCEDQVQQTLDDYIAACAALSPYDEQHERKLLDAEWKSEAEDAIRQYAPQDLAEKVIEMLTADEDLDTPDPSIEAVLAVVNEEDAKVYGAKRHIADLNASLRTHGHRLDANDSNIFRIRDQRDWTITYYQGLFAEESWSRDTCEYSCSDHIEWLCQLYRECRDAE